MPGGGAAVRSVLSGARVSEPSDESGTVWIRLRTYRFGPVGDLRRPKVLKNRI
jgi:hypothetical protein